MDDAPDAAAFPDPSGHRGLVGKAAASHPHQLADVVSTLSWSVRSPDDLLEHLQRTVDLAVRVVGGTVSAGITTDVRSTPTTTAHSGPLTTRLDGHQYAAGDGPCLTALRTGQLVAADVADGTVRWPRFTAAARGDGVASFLAVPLTPRPELTVGVLNLYGDRPDGFDADGVALALLVADHAGRTVDDYATLAAAQDLASHLEAALAHRGVIEQAKGILMAAHQVDDAAAFEMLRERSQRTNAKLHQICVEFVAEHTAADPT